jgi:hypothetical protein
MTADEFLQQIATYDSLVDGKISERDKLWELVTKITVPTDREVIQTSGVSDKVGNIGAKLADVERELDEIIDEYIDIQRECVKLIGRLADKPIEYRVIHKHYVLYKTLVDISQEECYSYDGIMRVKSRALKRIEGFLREENADSRKCT